MKNNNSNSNNDNNNSNNTDFHIPNSKYKAGIKIIIRAPSSKIEPIYKMVSPKQIFSSEKSFIVMIFLPSGKHGLMHVKILHRNNHG